MQMSGYTTASSTAAYPARFPQIVTCVNTPEDARALPKGCVVGDLHGGLTFSDQVAAVLERRSSRGWYECDGWTVIVLNR